MDEGELQLPIPAQLFGIARSQLIELTPPRRIAFRPSAEQHLSTLTCPSDALAVPAFVAAHCATFFCQRSMLNGTLVAFACCRSCSRHTDENVQTTTSPNPTTIL
jgi:hypothetical protein